MGVEKFYTQIEVAKLKGGHFITINLEVK